MYLCLVGLPPAHAHSFAEYVGSLVPFDSGEMMTEYPLCRIRRSRIRRPVIQPVPGPVLVIRNGGIRGGYRDRSRENRVRRIAKMRGKR